MESVFNAITTIIAFLGFFGISFAIEKSTIKINPLSIIKNFLVGDIIKKIEETEKARIAARAKEIKFELSNFEKLAINGIELTENDMALVRELYDEYHKQLKQNHYGTIVYNNIEELYKKQKIEKKN